MVSLYVERLSIGCERVIGRSHLQVSKVRRDDDDRRPVWGMRRDGSNRWARNNNWQFNKRRFVELQPGTSRLH